MKKLLVFCVMIVALGFVATGCGKKAKHAPTSAPAAEAPADAEHDHDHDHAPAQE